MYIVAAPQVCLPRYLFSVIPADVPCSILNKASVPSTRRGALLCLAEDLGGGEHALEMQCAAARRNKVAL